jgi:hypothetical protein
MAKESITFCLCLLLAVALAIPAYADCPFQTDLIAGQHTDAGDVLVWKEGCTLFVKYVASGCWRITETHLHVAGSWEEIPQTKKGNPIPGKFDHKGSHDRVTEVTYEIDLGGLCDSSVCIAAHAVVKCDGREETAWGDGTGFPGKNWAMYFCLTPEKCEEPVLLNGGFETPEVKAGEGWDIFPDGAVGLGWIVDWTSDVTGTPPSTALLELMEEGGSEMRRWLAHSGDQWAELDTDHDGPTGSIEGEKANVSIRQDINTCVGRTYKLTFYYSPPPGWGDNKIKVYWDGAQVGAEIVADGTGDAASTHWTQVQLPGLAVTGTDTVLAFVETGRPDSTGMFLDDVSVELEP